MPPADVAIVGGGIVGLATAHALLHGRARAVVVLEAENRVAAHQSGHNSGVVQDGAATDGTQEILASYGDHLDVVSEPDA